MEKDKISTFSMLLSQEITNLQRFVIKNPLGSDEFWSEWQSKAGEIIVTKAAIKRAFKLYADTLTEEEKLKLTSLLEAYKEISSYLELLRQTALKIKGIDAANWDIFDGLEGSDNEDSQI